MNHQSTAEPFSSSAAIAICMSSVNTESAIKMIGAETVGDRHPPQDRRRGAPVHGLYQISWCSTRRMRELRRPYPEFPFWLPAPGDHTTSRLPLLPLLSSLLRPEEPAGPHVLLRSGFGLGPLP